MRKVDNRCGMHLDAFKELHASASSFHLRSWKRMVFAKRIWPRLWTGLRKTRIRNCRVRTTNGWQRMETRFCRSVAFRHREMLHFGCVHTRSRKRTSSSLPANLTTVDAFDQLTPLKHPKMLRFGCVQTRTSPELVNARDAFSFEKYLHGRTKVLQCQLWTWDVCRVFFIHDRVCRRFACFSRFRYASYWSKI